MAKKRRQKEEKKDDEEYKFPEFDEVEYIKKETKKAKVTFITAGYAFLFGIFSYILFVITDQTWQVSVIIGIFAIFTLPILFRQIKFDMEGYDWKSWVGAGAIYFFVWLAVFIIVINPPFSDFAEPEIEPKMYYKDSAGGIGNWTEINQSKGDEYILDASDDMKISAKIYDNWKLDESSIKFTLIYENTPQNTPVMNESGNSEYEIVWVKNTLQPGYYIYKIEVEDEAGHLATYEGNFNVI